MRLFNCFRSSRSTKIKPITDKEFDINVSLAEISLHTVMAINVHKSILIANLKSFLSSNIEYKIPEFINRMYVIDINHDVYCFFKFDIDNQNNELKAIFSLCKNPSHDMNYRRKKECGESILEVSRLYTSFNRNKINISNLGLYLEKTAI